MGVYESSEQNHREDQYKPALFDKRLYVTNVLYGTESQADWEKGRADGFLADWICLVIYVSKKKVIYQ